MPTSEPQSSTLKTKHRNSNGAEKYLSFHYVFSDNERIMFCRFVKLDHEEHSAFRNHVQQGGHICKPKCVEKLKGHLVSKCLFDVFNSPKK